MIFLNNFHQFLCEAGTQSSSVHHSRGRTSFNNFNMASLFCFMPWLATCVHFFFFFSKRVNMCSLTVFMIKNICLLYLYLNKISHLKYSWCLLLFSLELYRPSSIVFHYEGCYGKSGTCFFLFVL